MELKEIIKRLNKIHEDADAVRRVIEESLPDGDEDACELWSVRGAIEAVTGAILLRQYREGNVTFHDPAEPTPTCIGMKGGEA